MSFLLLQGNIKPNKDPSQLEQWKARKTMGKS